MTETEYIKTTKKASIKRDNANIDIIHLLLPLKSNQIEYALPIDYSKRKKWLVHNLLSSIDGEQFDYEKFLLGSSDENNIEKFELSERDIKIKTLDIIIHSILVLSHDVSRLISFFPKENDEKLEFVRLQNLILLSRIPATFQAAMILSKNGFYIEVYTLLRTALEQLALVYEKLICNVASTRNPTKCINALKSKYEKVGELYGTLTDFVHLDEKSVFEMIHVDKDGIREQPRSGAKTEKTWPFFFIYNGVIYLRCKRLL